MDQYCRKPENKIKYELICSEKCNPIYTTILELVALSPDVRVIHRYLLPHAAEQRNVRIDRVSGGLRGLCSCRRTCRQRLSQYKTRIIQNSKTPLVIFFFFFVLIHMERIRLKNKYWLSRISHWYIILQTLINTASVFTLNSHTYIIIHKLLLYPCNHS